MTTTFTKGMIKMLELIIKNDNLEVSIINEKKEIKKINASIDIFDIEDDTFNSLIKYFYSEHNYSLEYLVLYLSSYFGIPKHNIEYDEKPSTINLDLKNYNLNNIDNEKLFKVNIKEIKKYLLNDTNITTTYYCRNKKDIAVACIYHYLKNGHSLNLCENCKQLFISVNKSTEKYCNRNINGKTCKIIKKREKGSLLEKDPIYNLRKNVYYSLTNRINRARIKGLKDDEAIKSLKQLVEEYPIWKEKLKNNQTSFEEYKKWINSFYKNNGKHNREKK